MPWSFGSYFWVIPLLYFKDLLFFETLMLTVLLQSQSTKARQLHVNMLRKST